MILQFCNIAAYNQITY